MKITVMGRTREYDTPRTVLQVLDDLKPECSKMALGAFVGGRALELTELLHDDCELSPITFQSEEGRRIYERSLRFIALMALRTLFPGEQVRVEHSLGYGVYLKVLGRILEQTDVENVESEMRHIAHQDLSFNKERWSRERAVEYFENEGDMDKAHLLSYRPYDYFDIYCCGHMAEYFYGAMLPSSGYVKYFKLRLVTPGMVIQMPSSQNPFEPAPYVSRPKHLAAFEESNRWCSVLKCTTASELNDLIVKGDLRSFIRVNEALHDKSISRIAEGILNRKSKAVFVAGPSSSGKTTFSNRLCIHLRVLGLAPVLVSLDDFYRNRNELPLESDGRPDLEAITALDIPLLKECLSLLLNGKEAMMPRFDFSVSRRKDERYPLRLKETQPIILEGIHGLNPELHSGLDEGKISKIYISELTCLNLDHHNRIRTTDARLLRRIVRDHRFRNTPPEETLLMWDSVRRGEERWIFPYQEQADYVFNSVLHYELPVLKNDVYDLLRQIEPENPVYLTARRLLKILNYILPAPRDTEKEIPPLSLLREFIGGCTFYD